MRPVLALGAAALAVALTLGTSAQADHSHEHKAGSGSAHSHDHKAGSGSAAHADHAGSGSAAPGEVVRAERHLAGGVVAYGADLALPTSTSIEALRADPEGYAGKTVRIAGTITEVCPKAGCWMKIADRDGAEVTLKVRDGVMVFPMSAQGKRAIAEGTVRKIELSEKQARAYLEHLAEEKGETFDPTTVKGPMTIVRVDGRGALIRPQ